GSNPVVTINNAVPADVVVTMNLDGRAASLTATFANAQTSVDVMFDAGLNRPGRLGNDISIAFTRANRQGQGPLVTFGGPQNDQIAVVLDTTGTTAAQLAAAINNNPLNQGIITVSLFGSPNVNVSDIAFTHFLLSGGMDPSTAQDV